MTENKDGNTALGDPANMVRSQLLGAIQGLSHEKKVKVVEDLEKLLDDVRKMVEAGTDANVTQAASTDTANTSTSAVNPVASA